MSDHVLTKIRDIKIPMWVKICFSMNGFARMMSSTFLTVYGVYYYTDLMGIDGKIVSAIFLISKIWDIVNDPMMGAMVDRTESKEGKCRFWLKYFSVPSGLLLALMFCVPNISSAGQIFWIAVTYIGYAMGCTANNIPANALLGRITSNKVERSKINQLNTIFSVAGSYLAMAVSLPLANLLGANNVRIGLSYVAIIYGVLYAVMFLTAYAVTKGYEPLEHLEVEEKGTNQVQEHKKKKTPILTVVRAAISNKVWLLCVVMYATYAIGESIMQSSMVQYYMYNLRDVNLVSLYSTITTPASVVGVLLLPLFIKKLGNGGTAMLGCILSSCGYLARFIFADQFRALMIASWGISSFGGGLIGATVLLCMFDSRVYGKWKTGVDNDAILMSGFTTAAKLGIAAGGPVAAFLLSMVNYVPQAQSQSASVMTLFRMENSLIPCICLIIGAISAYVVWRYEKKLPQMQAEIDAREASVGN
ncbi:glycoside-pentoside-hexuronide (GPH):cation symporter [Cuneatibacter sp. NSJ-177]|uniref:MFS transporter n=1 Tax=Cuneatibacter sp. NSJ-177 TaxID=2931401 RepID=UPI001FD46C07|nr:glycoside-pentoside-hexuronide (GPH):cation symporter [Cuneatibacter sp. NSJ-177]MCJ7837505.1 glycoside-pentoside-hexuronide (GPH):cation symporter [Cuneatibacter sp. NSJ-177]